MKETLKSLLKVYGPTGREQGIADVIEKMVAPYVDTVRRDAMGNLICERAGEGRRVMLAAHMDQIGYMVTDIDEKGFLRVAAVGGIHAATSVERHVVFENGVDGVLCAEKQNMTPDKLKLDNLFIDVGAASAEEAKKLANIGDVAVFAPDVFDLGEDLMASPAMDNRAGCCVLAEALKLLKSRKNSVYAVFTVQEEVGCRGAKAAAFDIAPDLGIALDVTLAGDTPKGAKVSMKVGDGPCVKIMDHSVVCSPKIVSLMEDAAERAGIKTQREVLVMGGTDAGAMQLARGGIWAGVISVPCRNVHSATEVVSVRDIEGGARLLAELLDGEI